MEHCTKEVLVRTKPKDSFTLVVSDNDANIQTTFSHPLNLRTNREYELAMMKRTIHSQIFEKAAIGSIRVLMGERLGHFSTYQLDVTN